MKKLFILAALTALSVPMTVAAQSVFDGTWKIDPTKVKLPANPDVYLLQDGMYECKTCVPPIKVKADGTDQPVSGSPYFDTLGVKVVNDHEVDFTYKKDGKDVGTGQSTVSPDGKTRTTSFTDSSNTNGGPPVTGKSEEILVAKGPAGSHAISGSWRAKKMDNMSDNSLSWTYKIDGGELTMTAPTGQSYTAKLDGSDAAMKGDPGVTTVSVKMIGKDTLQETDKRDGKVVGISTFKIASDGKSGKSIYEDKLQNRTYEATATKQ